jgi:hypothetical protein
MSKQTAVDFIMNEWKSKDFHQLDISWLFRTAKAMEKQQIKDAYSQGDEDGFHSTESQADYETEGRSDYLSEQYFQSVYGQS